MRTTLTLDDDLAHALRDAARHSGRSFKEIVNDTLRKGFRQGDKPGADPPPFQVAPKACGFRSGIDVLKLNQLHDELALEDFQEKLAGELARR